MLGDKIRLREFSKTIIILLCLYIVNIILANIFNWGDYYGYHNDTFQIGNLFADALYTNAYGIVLSFVLIYFFPKYKRQLIVLFVLLFVLILVNMKRTVIFSVCVGFFSMFFVNVFFNFTN